MRRKKEKVLKMMVIARNPQSREPLIIRFNESIRHCINGYSKDKMYRAGSAADAISKIMRGLDLDLIIFSDEFSEQEQDKLRDYFFSKSDIVMPRFVMLRPSSEPP